MSPSIVNCSNTREQAESQEEEENEDEGEDRNSHDESMCIDNYIYNMYKATAAENPRTH